MNIENYGNISCFEFSSRDICHFSCKSIDNTKELFQSHFCLFVYIISPGGFFVFIPEWKKESPKCIINYPKYAKYYPKYA
jgi:hypothetical protein